MGVNRTLQTAHLVFIMRFVQPSSQQDSIASVSDQSDHPSVGNGDMAAAATEHQALPGSDYFILSPLGTFIFHPNFSRFEGNSDSGS